MPAAIGTIHRVLKPGGSALVTFAGISKISPRDMARWGEFWRVTSLAARKMFEEVFAQANVQVESFGNVLTAISFLHGIAANELTEAELNHHDPCYELIIAVRAMKEDQ